MEHKFLWYMISTVSGKEDKVIESLRNRIISEQIEDCFDYEATEDGAFKIFKKPSLTPKEHAKKMAGEPYKIKYVNMYSGYIFIKMDMTDKAWFVIRNTQYVTGLIGSSGKGAKPTPVSTLEIKKCFKAEEKLQHDFDMGLDIISQFSIGEVVSVIEGPFKGETGPILNINETHKRATVEIEWLGKKTPTEFDFDNLISQE